jgi:hypothetical protein
MTDDFFSSQQDTSVNLGRQTLKVMTYGLHSRGAEIYHYFFAPNSGCMKSQVLLRVPFHFLHIYCC